MVPRHLTFANSERISQSLAMQDMTITNMSMLAEIIQVKRWRHRVQKAFFGKAPPKDADMPAMAEIFQQVEAHQMSEEALKQSKLGKVMKKIAKTKDDYPQESKFRFKERAEELYKRWIHVH
ncbi:unnamed protein product [Tilletia caries]|nr:hypothetical protein CF336_g7473 [Tilletia laevis]CAD6884350.1 unnamed protein product [Tilletia caries]